MSMKCDSYQDLIMRYFDRDLNGGEMESLDRHAQSCPRCRSLLGDLKKILNALERAPQAEPHPDLEKSVMARVRSLSLYPAKDEYRFIKIMYGSIVLAVLALTTAVTLNVQAIGFFDLVHMAAGYLNSFMEIIWNLQIVYDVSSGLFPHALGSLFHAIQSVFIAGVIGAVVLCLKIVLLGSGGINNKSFIN